MTSVPRPHCYWCKHNRHLWKCDAFPDGIPDAIAESRRAHMVPYPGDHGIQFELIEGEKDEWVFLGKVGG